MSGPGTDGFAIIGWGSLLWRPGELAVAGAWSRSGPILPIEFSRVSNDGRLTLVIDEDHGVRCPTWVCRAALRMDAAIQNLADRERCPCDDIGRVRVGPDAAPATDPVSASIASWCERAGFEGALWTGLPSTFHGVTGTDFCVEAGVDYLDGLTGSRRGRAFEYIRRAPPTTRTPLRSAFESQWPAA